MNLFVCINDLHIVNRPQIMLPSLFALPPRQLTTRLRRADFLDRYFEVVRDRHRYNLESLATMFESWDENNDDNDENIIGVAENIPLLKASLLKHSSALV